MPSIRPSAPAAMLGSALSRQGAGPSPSAPSLCRAALRRLHHGAASAVASAPVPSGPANGAGDGAGRVGAAPPRSSHAPAASRGRAAPCRPQRRSYCAARRPQGRQCSDGVPRRYASGGNSNNPSLNNPSSSNASFHRIPGFNSASPSPSPSPILDLRAGHRLLVVGSGVAGCAAALVAAETHGVPVTLLFAGAVPTDCNSYWAQGGIISRNDDPAAGDSAQSLARDIHRAGAGLCVDAAVRKVAVEGPGRVRQLLLDGREGTGRAFANVPFDRLPNGSLSHCLEASHSASRILHRADSTGAAITDHITAAAVAHPLITILGDAIVTDLAIATDPATDERVCVGAHVIHAGTREASVQLATRGTVLASGGLGGIYEHSTNPPGFNALGSSAALATRAGADTKDLEYVQFHPTSLYLPSEARFLLTEALRGEGAILRDAEGRAFAKDFHPDGELAPRDVVARGVYAEAQKGDGSVHNAYLDISHRDESWLRGRFPTIDAHLASRGLDLARDRLPVIPAAHYACGGIQTDLNGRTTLRGLYSAGEAARTGLHGGNRLASTSLLEGLVYGAAVADFVGAAPDAEEALEGTMSALNSPAGLDELAHQSRSTDGRRLDNGRADATMGRASELLADIRRTMWNGVGVVRTPAGLREALDLLDDMNTEALELFDACPTHETAAARDAACAGQAVAAAALANRESRGAHCIESEEGSWNGDEEGDEEGDYEEVSTASS